MLKDDGVYVGHMFDLARTAQRLVQGKCWNDYDSDEVLQLALTHVLQTIGESARHISASFQQAHPEIPWLVIVGMRHKIVHDYLDVDYDVVWQTVIEDVPELIRLLEALIFSDKPLS